MKKSRFTETQIVGILKRAESGIEMVDLLRTHRISGPTLSNGDPNIVALKLLSPNG